MTKRQNGGMAVTHIALLRGINLGGKNKAAMAELRALVAGLGHGDVSTYIQSGNVLFRAVPADADAARAKAAERGAADEARVIGRTLYLRTPDGFGRSDLAATIMQIVSSPAAGVTGTARNWATTVKLLELCGQ